ncbi:MAG: hypothetical protein EGP89_01970 [Ruminococcaceae bacterium]|nr:hypothetical protein [Oscillospiraceae bacterium]
MKLFQNRKFKYGTMATVFTIVFIALIIAVNFAATALVDRFPFKIDVTDKGLNTLSEETTKYLELLDRDITISVLAKEDEFKAYGDQTCQMYYQYGIDVLSYMPNVNELIKQYARYSDHVTVRYVDILQDPNFVSKYPNDKLAQGQILISSGDRYKILNAIDLFYIKQDDYSVYLKAEKTLTSAIMVTALENLTKVQTVTGHNEGDAAGLTSLLEQNAYEVSEVNLSTGDIAADTDILLLMAPMVDFSEEELKKIDTFLENGGDYGKHVFYFAGYNRAETPLLDAFLKEWGIEVSMDTVVETDYNKYFNRNPFLNAADYADETYGSKYKSLSTKMMMPYCVPLRAIFTENGNRSTETLLSFTSTAVAMPKDAAEGWTPDKAERKGPFDAAIVGKRTTYQGLDEYSSTVTVFGSVLAADSSLLSSSLYTNAEYLLDVFNGQSENTISLSIYSKSLGNAALNMTTSAQNTLGIIFVGVVPVAALALGLVIWMRRRNK